MTKKRNSSVKKDAASFVAINYTRGAICSARQTHAKKRIKRKIIV
jgi:hypothetical protein